MPWIPGQPSLEDWENRFPSCDAVPTVRREDLSPDAFRAEFMSKNLPVMITGITDDWRACREWVTKDGQPDVVAMSELFGDAKVLVVDCDEAIDTDLKRREMPFREFASWWRSSETRKRAAAGAHAAREKLYVKDWNFVGDFPAYRAYDTPPHVNDDWLNDCGSNEDDVNDDARKQSDDPTRLRPGSFRFVYLGVEGTWTPMHVDVARSYSWSANVCGRKKWLMVPPSRAKYLRHRDGSGRLIPDVRAARLAEASKNFPDASLAAPLTVLQPPGSLLFVPSCWAHQVHNETDCLSINHNWFNDCTFGVSVAYLRFESRLIRLGLPDHDDRADGVLCQRLLARKAGINQLILGSIGVWGLRRVLESTRSVDSTRSSDSEAFRERHRARRLRNVFQPLRHLVHETHFFAVSDACEEKFGERHNGPPFDEGNQYFYRPHCPGVGDVLGLVVSTLREVPTENTSRARKEADAFVESFDVDPWEENADALAEIVDVLRRAGDDAVEESDDEESDDEIP